MAINEFKPFAATADANVQEQADYEQSDTVRSGFRNGLARSAEVNKAIRQASSITAAIAEFTAEKSGKDMLDDGDIAAIKTNFEMALSAVSTLLIAQAEGDADALMASFTPEVKALKNGLMVHVRGKEKNLTKTPGFKADATAAKTIVKGNNLALAEGDIAGAGHWLEMQYDEALDKWVLLNPAKGITPQSGVPVGTVEYFAMATPPAGYLKADGAAVGRETYPDLFAAIGTTFGAGDGATTFNLPDLIGRFPQGSTTPGSKIEAGLPNITGSLNMAGYTDITCGMSGYGAFKSSVRWDNSLQTIQAFENKNGTIPNFSAADSHPIYGASNTVQPPALTLLPCIKAFDAVTNSGLIDITELANDVDGKLDKSVDGTAVKYITKTFNDGTNWYRKWSDGWVEQGGMIAATIATMTVTYLVPFANNNYCILKNLGSGLAAGDPSDAHVSFYNLTQTSAQTLQHSVDTFTRWYACGQGT